MEGDLTVVTVCLNAEDEMAVLSACAEEEHDKLLETVSLLLYILSLLLVNFSGDILNN